VDKSQWSAPQWQAHISRLEPFSERKRVLEEEVPAEYQGRVKRHLQTVRAIAKYHKRVKEERLKRV